MSRKSEGDPTERHEAAAAAREACAIGGPAPRTNLPESERAPAEAGEGEGENPGHERDGEADRFASSEVDDDRG